MDSPPEKVRFEHLLREHLGVVLTLGYVFLSGLGMLHVSLVLLGLGVNIFDYAEPSDFLLAAVRDPLVVLLCIAPVPFFWAQHRLFHWLAAKYPRWGGWSRRLRITGAVSPRAVFRWNVFATLLWALAFSLHYANYVSDSIRDGGGRKVQAQLVSEGLGGKPWPATLPRLVTGTSKFVFLYFPETAEMRIVPVENIAQLVVKRPPRRSDKAAVRPAPGGTAPANPSAAPGDPPS